MTETLEPGAGIDRRRWRKRFGWRANLCPLLLGIALTCFATGEGWPWRLFFYGMIAFALGRIDKGIDP